jgi:hypothetical protein
MFAEINQIVSPYWIMMETNQTSQMNLKSVTMYLTINLSNKVPLRVMNNFF